MIYPRLVALPPIMTVDYRYIQAGNATDIPLAIVQPFIAAIINCVSRVSGNKLITLDRRQENSIL